MTGGQADSRTGGQIKNQKGCCQLCRTAAPSPGRIDVAPFRLSARPPVRLGPER